MNNVQLSDAVQYFHRKPSNVISFCLHPLSAAKQIKSSGCVSPPDVLSPCHCAVRLECMLACWLWESISSSSVNITSDKTKGAERVPKFPAGPSHQLGIIIVYVCGRLGPAGLAARAGQGLASPRLASPPWWMTIKAAYWKWLDLWLAAASV